MEVFFSIMIITNYFYFHQSDLRFLISFTFLFMGGGKVFNTVEGEYLAMVAMRFNLAYQAQPVIFIFNKFSSGGNFAGNIFSAISINMEKRVRRDFR